MLNLILTFKKLCSLLSSVLSVLTYIGGTYLRRPIGRLRACMEENKNVFYYLVKSNLIQV